MYHWGTEVNIYTSQIKWSLFDSNDFNGRNLKEKTTNSDPKYSIFLLSMPDLGKFWGF